MSVLVLVHGSWHDGEAWTDVAVRKYLGHKQVTHKPWALHSMASVAARLAAAALLAL